MLSYLGELSPQNNTLSIQRQASVKERKNSKISDVLQNQTNVHWDAFDCYVMQVRNDAGGSIKTMQGETRGSINEQGIVSVVDPANNANRSKLQKQRLKCKIMEIKLIPGLLRF